MHGFQIKRIKKIVFDRIVRLNRVNTHTHTRVPRRHRQDRSHSPNCSSGKRRSVVARSECLSIVVITTAAYQGICPSYRQRKSVMNKRLAFFHSVDFLRLVRSFFFTADRRLLQRLSLPQLIQMRIRPHDSSDNLSSIFSLTRLVDSFD